MATKNKSASFEDKLNAINTQIESLLRQLAADRNPNTAQKLQQQIASLTKKRQDLISTRESKSESGDRKEVDSEQNTEFLDTVEDRVADDDFANIQNIMRDRELIRIAGGSVEDVEAPVKAKRPNVSTEIGETQDSAYRITSGKEPVTSGNLRDIMSSESDRELIRIAGGSVPEMVEPEAAPPKAVPVAPEDDEMLSTLFKTATGTPFDPKSSRDADYMKKIRETLAEQGGLKGMTPTQFALKLYRKYD